MNSSQQKPCVSAIILAGGQGRRFGSRDKGLLEWRGKRFVQRVFERIESQVQDVVISCNRNIGQYQQLADCCVSDELPDYCGPLAGVAASLPHCQCDQVVLVPCDAIKLPPDLVARLSQCMDETGCDVALAFDGERDQYLFSLIRKSLHKSLLNYLEMGGRSVRGWYESVHTERVDFSAQASAFININSEEELSKLD